MERDEPPELLEFRRVISELEDQYIFLVAKSRRMHDRILLLRKLEASNTYINLHLKFNADAMEQKLRDNPKEDE